MDVGERWLFANVNGLLGFEVVDAQSGAILYRVSPPGYPFESMPDYTQSHGVAMSPDGREVWVVDQPYNRVHVFDVTGLPAVAPKAVEDVALQGSLSEPGPRQGREGWLQFSRDGHYVYVGDAGDVIEAATRRIVTHLDALSKTRKILEIDFDAEIVLNPTKVGRSWAGNSAAGVRFSEISAEPVTRWQGELNEDEIGWVEMHCRDLMSEFGYEPRLSRRSLRHFAKPLFMDAIVFTAVFDPPQCSIDSPPQIFARFRKRNAKLFISEPATHSLRSGCEPTP